MNINKILVPVDGSERSLEAIGLIKDIFANKSLELHLLNVVDMSKYMVLPNYTVEESIKSELLSHSNEILDQASALLPAEYTVVKSSMAGTPYEHIVKYAEKENVDMIVIARKGLSNIQRFLVGSVTSKVVSHAGVPVLVVPEGR